MRLRPALLACALAALAGPAAHATDLLDAWRAAAVHDPQVAAARAARDAGAARAAQAAALWRPGVTLEAGAGRTASESSTRGARFAAPAFGQSTGVAFDTSVDDGSATRYALTLRQPLYDRVRDAQAAQLRTGAEAAEHEWQAAEQALLLRSAERYFETALAAQQLRLFGEQERAARQVHQEAEDRFRIGDRPVTDVHEAAARAAGWRAQRLAAQSELEATRARLADLMGAAPDAVLALPRSAPGDDAGELARWLEQAGQTSPAVLLAADRVRQAEQEVRKSDRRASPAVDLVAQLGRERQWGSGDFGSASQAASRRAIGVQLTVPLYDGGGRDARQAEALAALRTAEAELERARQDARRQAREAWLELSTGAGRIAALESAREASLARLDATRTGLQAGDRTTLDLLNAQNDAAAAELALLRARVQQVLQRLRLAAAAGTLDETQLAAANALLAPPR